MKTLLPHKYFGGLIIVLMAVSLSACGGLPVSNVVNLTTKSGSQGDQFVTVRTRILDGSSTRGKEVADAQCRMTLGSRTKSFKSPAKVRVPKNGAKSGALAVRCTYEGYRPGTITSEPINVSAAQRSHTASQGGLLGVLVIGVAGGFSDKANDVYGYKKEVTVTMSK